MSSSLAQYSDSSICYLRCPSMKMILDISEKLLTPPPSKNLWTSSKELTRCRITSPVTFLLPLSSLLSKKRSNESIWAIRTDLPPSNLRYFDVVAPIIEELDCAMLFSFVEFLSDAGAKLSSTANRRTGVLVLITPSTREKSSDVSAILEFGRDLQAIIILS